MQLILASAKIMRSADSGLVPTMTTPAFDDEAHRLAMELSNGLLPISPRLCTVVRPLPWRIISVSSSSW